MRGSLWRGLLGGCEDRIPRTAARRTELRPGQEHQPRQWKPSGHHCGWEAGKALLRGSWTIGRERGPGPGSRGARVEWAGLLSDPPGVLPSL